MQSRKTETETTKVPKIDTSGAWTSTVLNTLFDLFRDSVFSGMPLKGISLTTECIRHGHRKAQVSFQFEESAT